MIVFHTVLLMRIIAVLFLALNTFATANRDPATAQLAREVGTKGWIVYSAHTDKGDWDLFLSRPDGTHVRNITNTPDSSEIGGRFSPDGRRLLFRRIAPGTKIHHDTWGAAGQLVITNADGSNPVVYGAPGEFPWATWSPDGKQVACLTRTGIEIRDLATKAVVRKLDRQGIYQQLFWSPDGKWFTGPANRLGESWTVVRLSAVTGEVNSVAKFQNCTPDWFPDSRRLIYSSRPAHQEPADGGSAAKAVGQTAQYGWTQLYMSDGDGQNRTLLYGEDGKHIYGGAVSPDGRYVVFTRSRTDGDLETAAISVMRLSDAPVIVGESKFLRSQNPKAKSGPVLGIQAGWEPHWTAAAIPGSR
jgi:Tol biopolymer transport system component